MVKCSAPLCGNATYHKTPDITFHRIPKNKHMKRAWCIKMNRPDWEPASSSIICSKHFEAHLIDNSGNRTVLSPGAIPTIFDFVSETPLASTVTNTEHNLCNIQNIQPCVMSAAQNNEEDMFMKNEKIKKMKIKDTQKTKTIKTLKQHNRRLIKKVKKLSEIIASLKKTGKEQNKIHLAGNNIKNEDTSVCYLQIQCSAVTLMVKKRD